MSEGSNRFLKGGLLGLIGGGIAISFPDASSMSKYFIPQPKEALNTKEECSKAKKICFIIMKEVTVLAASAACGFKF